jgi:glycine/D-amino acid oxidase-like deaminating enzyme
MTLVTTFTGKSQRSCSRSRRRFLASSCKLAAIASVISPVSLVSSGRREKNIGRPKKPHVVVVGAGAFGGWAALYLTRGGAQVTLLDTWGPGNSRASSGGETRVIRGTYGPGRIYTEMASRALQLWKENETKWKRRVYQRTGILWMVGGDSQFEQASLPILTSVGWKFEELSYFLIAKRYPQINLDGIKWAIFEPDGGYPKARESCAAVVEGLLSEGGKFRQVAVEPPAIHDGELSGLSLSDGTILSADYFIFACGPWLGRLFPDIIGERIKPTRQEVFFFGTPAGETRFSEGIFPVWADHQERLRYGIPGNEGRGFKVADDTRGPLFDPTAGDRMPSLEALASIREFLAFRFPALKNSPLLEARVCQYENSPDGNFIIDRHPSAQNVWLLGGGSGHGFKHGPAVGELVSQLVLANHPVPSTFSLARFAPQS